MEKKKELKIIISIFLLISMCSTSIALGTGFYYARAYGGVKIGAEANFTEGIETANTDYGVEKGRYIKLDCYMIF